MKHLTNIAAILLLVVTLFSCGTISRMPASNDRWRAEADKQTNEPTDVLVIDYNKHQTIFLNKGIVDSLPSRQFKRDYTRYIAAGRTKPLCRHCSKDSDL